MKDETRNFYEDVTKRSKLRDQLERDTEAFFANDGHIQEIPNGVSAMNNGTPEKLLQTYSLAGKKGARNNNVLRGNRV